ncbi:hypothetical protein ABEB36_003714 [Hypothenemus hampei]|uniref:Golgin-45 n=1 Tax=Hypothenemus hampei TaxID=57062 RepID=A0ABD1F197_HYPHA
MNKDQNWPERTLGDGMENRSLKYPEIVFDRKLSEKILASMKPVQPKTKIINLVPRYVPQEKKHSNTILTKPKEPKFVPYEPYKAAVQPIKTQKSSYNSHSTGVHSKKNVEIKELVNQMSEMRIVEMNKLAAITKTKDEFIPKEKWGKEKEAYEIDIKNLQETNAHLECQLKFQAQVNSELKTLLVAAVGEDLESRVQHLTEDKLALARALLNSANHLTSHQEQTEWLSGQCEVWRSKFLASSLMVEELARWKSALTKRTNDLQDVIKKMLSDQYKMQKQMLKTYSNLNLILEKSLNKKQTLQFGDIAELSSVNLELSEKILSIYGINNEEKDVNQNYVNAYSPTEQYALKVLKNPLSLTSTQDLLCNALVGAAHSLTHDQKFVQNPSLHPCCTHCSGRAQDI